MAKAAAAGFAYVAAVFAIAFALGALRVSFVAPRVGELAAVMIEIPFILTASWIICAKMVTRFGVPALLGPRIGVGLVAFTVLMVAETLLGLAMGRSLACQISAYGAPAASVGLAGQFLFGCVPVMQLASIAGLRKQCVN
jgi:hypothetical protein